MAKVKAQPTRPSFVASALNTLVTLTLTAAVLIICYLLWPYAMKQWQTGSPVQATAQPTTSSSSSGGQSTHDGRGDVSNNAATPVLNLEQISATSTAIYQATVQAAEPPPNINATGDSAPLVVEEKPVMRQGAGENVPTAEPIAPAQSDEQTGSKPVLIAPQETHTCRHGQVWIDGKGCKNP